MKIKNLIWIIALLLIPISVNAENITFDFKAEGSLGLKNWTLIDFVNSTVHLDFEQNVSTQGYVYTCEHFGDKTTFNPCWTNEGTDPNEANPVSNVTLGGSTSIMKTTGTSFKSAVTGSNSIFEAYLFDEFGQSGAGEFLMGFNNPTGCGGVQGDIGVDFSDSENFLIRPSNNCDPPSASTNIRYNNDKKGWFYYKSDDGRNNAWISNFTFTDTLPGISGTVNQVGFRDAYMAPPIAVYATRMQLRDTSSIYNSSRTIFAINKTFSSTVTDVIWNYRGQAGSSGVKALISCDNGNNWVESATNNSQVTCAISGTKVRVHFNLTTATSNITYLEVLGVSLPPDTTPPIILHYNLSTPSGDCTVWNTSKSTACPTGDTTPAISITTDDSSDCAIGKEDKNFTYYNNLSVNRWSEPL